MYHVKLNGQYKIWTDRNCDAAAWNDSVVQVTRIVVETPTKNVEVEVTRRGKGNQSLLHTTVYVILLENGYEFVISPEELVPYDQYSMKKGNLIWGGISCVVEASTLDGSKETWPRNKCPHCGDYFHRKDLFPKYDREGDITHWVIFCPTCNTKLTVYND